MNSEVGRNEIQENSETRKISPENSFAKFDRPIDEVKTNNISDESTVNRYDKEIDTVDKSLDADGYERSFDSEGRTVSAEGQLHIKDTGAKREDISVSIHDIGQGYEKDTDDRGHLIGDQFGGTSNAENLTPQDSNLNRGSINKFECSLAAQVKSGKEVYLKVEPTYIGDSRRPSEYCYTTTIDGETNVTVFRNGENNND
jgi:hypothetical protein